MGLQVRYNSATDVADVVTVRQGASFSAAAEEGAVATSQIIVDDPDNSLNYVGLRRLYAYETTAPAHNQMVYNGYLQDRTIGRQPAEGPDDDEEVMGRRWALNVADTNSLLSRRLITGADGDRPAETDIARIQWLLDSNDSYLSNPHDTWENPSPYIDTGDPVDMDAADLRGQTAFDVLNDCAQRSGKFWFATYYEANDSVPPTNNGSIALFYAFDYSTLYSSTLRLTNVRADVDNATTFAVLPDASLSRDPTRAYSGVYLTYDGGSLYAQSTNVANLFQQRDAAVSNVNIKTAAKATALATRYLGDASSEDDRISARFVVPKQHVNLLREGQRFEAKFSHLPGLSSYTWLRCLRRTVTPRSDEEYEIAITATGVPVPSLIQSKSSGMISGGTVSVTVTLDTVPVPGDTLIAALYTRNYTTPVWPAGWALEHFVNFTGGGYPNQSIEVRSRVVQAGDTGVQVCAAVGCAAGNLGNAVTLTVIELAGAVVGQVVDAGSVGTTITIPAIATGRAILLGFHCRITSATPRNTPTDWTLLHTGWDDLSDRQLTAAYSRSVPGATYSGTFEGGVEGANTAGFVVVEMLGA